MVNNEREVLGVSLSNWMRFIERIGIPAGALFAIIISGTYVVGWVLGPPIVNGHVKFLEKTATALDGMIESQEKMTIILQDVGDTSSDMDPFMRVVHDEHIIHGQKIDDVAETLDKVYHEVRDENE